MLPAKPGAWGIAGRTAPEERTIDGSPPGRSVRRCLSRIHWTSCRASAREDAIGSGEWSRSSRLASAAKRPFTEKREGTKRYMKDVLDRAILDIDRAESRTGAAATKKHRRKPPPKPLGPQPGDLFP